MSLDTAHRHYSAADTLRRRAADIYLGALVCGAFGLVSGLMAIVDGAWWLLLCGLLVVACSWLCDAADTAQRLAERWEWRGREVLRIIHNGPASAAVSSARRVTATPQGTLSPTPRLLPETLPHGDTWDEARAFLSDEVSRG